MSEKRETKPLDEVSVNMSNALDDPPSTAAAEVLAFKPSPVQARILQIAKEIMDDHYVLDSDQLYHRCIRSIKDIAPQEINDALLVLLKQKILVHGKATTRQTILENENRTAVLNAVKNNPGIHLNKLATIVPINRGTIKWHLEMLTKFDLIKARNIENQLAFFEFIIEPRLEQMYYILNKKHVTRIARVIESQPGITITEAITTLNIPRSTFLRKIKDMVAEGLVVLDVASDSEACLHLSPPMEKATREFLSHCSDS
jgi:predicted transcriptional regulator